MTAAAPLPPPSATPGRRALELLGSAERRAGDTGAIVVPGDGGAAGTIFLERGRVCWCAAPKLGRRLGDLLVRHRLPEARSTIHQIIRDCLREGRPFGEALVDSGTVSERGLHDALEEHTAESLLAAASTATGEPLWVPHKHHRYDARFTFAPPELVNALGTAAAPALAARARSALHRVLRGGGTGIAYALGGDAPSPICAHRTEGVFLRELLRLGDWCASVLRGALASGAVVGARLPNDAHLVAWVADDLLLVLLGRDATSLGMRVATVTALRPIVTPPSGAFP